MNKDSGYPDVSPFVGGDRDFSTTALSTLFAAADGSLAEGHPSFDKLAKQYWKPLYVFARCGGRAHDLAQNAVQEVLARICSPDCVASYPRENGGFRKYLVKAMQNEMRTEIRKSRTLKRDTSKEIPFLSEEGDKLLKVLKIKNEPPEVAFDYSHAYGVFTEALTKLRSQAAPALVALWERENFAVFGIDEEGRRDLAAALATTEDAVRKKVERLTPVFREFLKAEVRESCTTESECEDESKYLLKCLARKTAA